MRGVYELFRYGSLALDVYLEARGRYGFDDGHETCGACRDDSQSR